VESGYTKGHTKVLRVDPLNPEMGPIRFAAEYIRRGELVAFPTETVYGLGADATNGAAVRRIFEAKGRPMDNPVIVHIAAIDQLSSVARVVDKRALSLADVYWPGPLTIVFPKANSIADEATAFLDTVAVRMPAHPVALSLIMMAGRPIAAPSANLSGRPSPTTAEHVLEDLGDKVPVILDGGETAFGLESTVISLAADPPTILRPGPITVDELAGVLGEVQVAAPRSDSEAGAPPSPGLKYPHYAPRAPLVLVLGSVNGMPDKIAKLAKEEVAKGKKVGILATDETKGRYQPDSLVISVGTRFNPYSVAHNLYAALRSFDMAKVDVIFAEGFEEKGILLTVMNRLHKAASKIVQEY
jgi:L-threonylcarbamoyladenylate synthase